MLCSLSLSPAENVRGENQHENKLEVLSSVDLIVRERGRERQKTEQERKITADRSRERERDREGESRAR